MSSSQTSSTPIKRKFPEISGGSPWTDFPFGPSMYEKPVTLGYNFGAPVYRFAPGQLEAFFAQIARDSLVLRDQVIWNGPESKRPRGV